MGPACCSRPVRAASHGSGDRFGEVYPPDGHDRSMSAIRKLKRALRAARNPRHWNALAHAVVPTIEHGTAFVGVEPAAVIDIGANKGRSEEHTSELQSLMRISYAVFCLKKKNQTLRESK